MSPGGQPLATFFMEILVAVLLLEAAVIAVSYVTAYVYYVEMMFRFGQTFGKKVMKIKVPGLNYLDRLWQLWDKPYQQCLHDKFAKTLVVKVPG